MRMEAHFEQCALAEFYFPGRDTCHRFTVVRGTHAGENAEEAGVNPEDWLDVVTQLRDHIQASPVATEDYEQIAFPAELANGKPGFLAGNTCRFAFQLHRKRGAGKFLHDLPDEFCRPGF